MSCALFVLTYAALKNAKKHQQNDDGNRNSEEPSNDRHVNLLNKLCECLYSKAGTSVAAWADATPWRSPLPTQGPHPGAARGPSAGQGD